MKPRLALITLLLSAACTPGRPGTVALDTLGLEPPRLPTGVRLDPAGTQHDLRAAMPFGMVLAPGGRSVVISSAGYREPGLDVIDRTTGAITQSLPQYAAFLGLAFAPTAARSTPPAPSRTWCTSTRGPRTRQRSPTVSSSRARTSNSHETRYPAGLPSRPTVNACTSRSTWRTRSRCGPGEQARRVPACRPSISPMPSPCHPDGRGLRLELGRADGERVP